MTLTQLLESHSPTDAKEVADLAAMRAYAQSLEAPFSRRQWPAHFTGSAVVVTPDGSKVCLVLHAKLNRWLQPGGHCEASDAGAMAATALREAREETGCAVELHPRAPKAIDVDIHTIPARKDEPEHQHLDVRYLLVAQAPEQLQFDPAESHGAQWLPWDKALSLADEAPLRRLLLKAQSACG